MKSIFYPLTIFFSLLVSSASTAQISEKEQLTNLLLTFLKGASANNAEIHDRFWAEDLIYTSSSGERYGKKQIIDGLRDDSNSSEDSEESNTTYSAEDIQIQMYDDMAVVAFRLVGKTKTSDGTQSDYYLNSGTFLKRNDRWKVVNWQATKVPETN